MRVALSLAASVLLAGSALAQAPAGGGPAVPTREQGALVLQGVPEVPAEVRERLRRYANTRGAAFADWLPDGSMLVTTRFGSTAQLHHVKAPGAARRQLTFFDEPIAEAVARPGGRGEYVFARDTGGDEYFQGYAAGLTGFETPITEPRTRNQALTFSPDGRLLAWSRVTPGDPNYDIVTMTPGQPATRRVALEGTGAMAPADVAADGRILVAKALSNVETELFLLDPRTGRDSELNPTNGKVRYEGGEFTPDGRSVLVLSDQDSDLLRLVRIDLASGRPTVLIPGLKWDVETFDLAPDGRTLAYSVNEDGVSRVRLMTLDGGRALPGPELPIGVVNGLKFSPDGRQLAISLSAATAPSDVWSYDLAGRRLTRWTESELGGLDPASFVAPTVVRFPSFDKRSIPAFVYRPKATGGRSPVIIDIHGGPEAQARPAFTSTYQYWVNELGAAVIVPNVRGSDGYGKTYLNLDNAERREDSVKDIGALLDWIATQPDLDPKRVVVSGGSYGGYMVLASLVHYSDRLAGGINTVGISNWVTFLTNTEGYRRDLRRAEYGDERDPKMRAVLERISPLNNAQKITTPLLVIQGDNDPRVPKSEADQIVAKVRGQGNAVWYVRARNEGHGFRKKENIDARREIETLFLRKVLGLTPPG